MPSPASAFISAGGGAAASPAQAHRRASHSSGLLRARRAKQLPSRVPPSAPRRRLLSGALSPEGTPLLRGGSPLLGASVAVPLSSSCRAWSVRGGEAGVSGKGPRFLLLAGRQVDSQTGAATQLKGASLGVRCALASPSAAASFSERGAQEGGSGDELPRAESCLARSLQAGGRAGGQVVGTTARNCRGSSEKDPPPSRKTTPFHLLYICIDIGFPSVSPSLTSSSSDRPNCCVPAPISSLEPPLEGVARQAATGFLPPTQRGSESQGPPRGRAMLGSSSLDETDGAAARGPQSSPSARRRAKVPSLR